MTSLVANTAEEKHTPTPWRVDTNMGGCVVAMRGGLIATCDDGNYFTNPGDGPINAAFIVLACNSFDALTEANAKLSSALQRLVSAVEFMRTMGAYRGGSLAGMGELDRAEAEGRAALKSTGAK